MLQLHLIHRGPGAEVQYARAETPPRQMGGRVRLEESIGGAGRNGIVIN